MGLAELAAEAGVSVRTVRYYIAEGLLPPPESAGPRAAYTREHLDRLHLVGRLKAAYLPLREIRQRLRGLDAAAVRDLLAHEVPESAPAAGQDVAGDDDGSAAAYLARLLPPRPTAVPSPRFAPVPPPASTAPTAPVGFLDDAPEQSTVAMSPADLTRADLDRGATLAALAALDAGEETASATEAEPWRRVSLGPDAELLIRADVYARQREQIESLVAWARRVLG